MVSVVQVLVFSLLVFTLPKQAFSCKKRKKPLLLSPYLARNEIKRARFRSKVDRNCLEDFVPESHTGFITVDEELGNHLFFWFFPHSTNENAPLLLWLNGGPTVSSMLGLFWENGPMEIVRRKTSENGCRGKYEMNGREYRQREYSWTKSFSMLYVDSPVGVGFSFSDNDEKGYRFTEEGYTKDMISFLKQFFKLFPEYKSSEFYIGGQSYDGKYISAFAYGTHLQIQQNRLDFNLSGIYLGAPYFDPETQNEAFYDYLYAMGVISHKSLVDAKMECRKLYARAKSGDLNEFDLFGFSYSSANFDTGGSFDNVVTGEVAGYNEIASLLTTSKMRRAAHAGHRKFVGVMKNQDLALRFTQAMLVSTKTKLAELMDNYKVLIYNGNYNVAVSSPMIEAALLTTPWTYQGEYNETKRSTWRRNEKTVGYYSLTDKFCRVVINGAGHQVPHDKPEISYIMIQQFIDDGCVSDVFYDIAGSSSSLATGSFLNSVLLTFALVKLVF